MLDLLPHSRPINGLIMAIEGLAVWVVAIFLSSLRATGWLIWPGADMYTTTVGTMHAWLTSGAVSPFELIGYFGLLIAVGGPAWFWIADPLIHNAKQRRSPAKRSDNLSLFGDEEDGWGDDWIPATEMAEASNSIGSTDESVWSVIDFDPPRSEPGSIQSALVRGDFLRGSGSTDKERKTRDSSGQS